MVELYLFRLLAQINIQTDDLELPQGAPTSSTVTTVLQLAFGVLGGIAFLVIILAGLRYTLSRGNPDDLTKSRNAIVYAAVGLVICVLAFSIVRFTARGVS